HRSPNAGVLGLKLGEELPLSHLGRREVAHHDVSNERSSDGISGCNGSNDRIRRLEHRSKKISRKLVVLDHQHMNHAKLRTVAHIFLALNSEHSRLPIEVDLCNRRHLSGRNRAKQNGLARRFTPRALVELHLRKAKFKFFWCPFLKRVTYA